MSNSRPVRVGIVTVSDRASRGEYQDLGGPAIRDCLTEILSCPWEAVPRLIPDERPLIEATLKELCDDQRCCLVVTTNQHSSLSHNSASVCSISGRSSGMTRATGSHGHDRISVRQSRMAGPPRSS